MEAERDQTVQEVGKESVGTSLSSITKQMKTLPIRIIEEEVWFSGSELKTDNSSSDEEQTQTIKSNITKRLKKGAKRKTKFVSSSKSSSKTILTQNEEYCSKTTKGTSSRTLEETTSMASSSSSDSKKSETLNEIDDLNIQELEEKIVKAEKAYLSAKSKTDLMIIELENVLKETRNFKTPNLRYLHKITQNWLDCISRVRQVKAKNQKRPCKKRPRKLTKKGLRSKKSVHCNLFFQNIQHQFFKNKNIRKSNLIHISSEENSNTSNKSDESYANPYQLEPLEIEKISEIDEKIKNSINERKSPNTEQSLDVTLEGSFLNSINGYYESTMSDSTDEFNSCEESIVDIEQLTI